LAWDGDERVKPRSQAGLAVSADGESWTLINASPDLREQIRKCRALQPRGAARASPIKSVVLTGAEIDQVTGLLSLRESEPFTLFATQATLDALADNPMFRALARDVVARRPALPGVPLQLLDGVQVELFTVPGKVPLYLEEETVEAAEETRIESGITVGV
jgi:pyrroloquinoline quinone biosynthesis protein B